VVLINAGALAITWTSKNVPAIVEAFYPGELGGDAIVSILFGDVSPAGRLPVTIYDESLMAARDIFDMNLRDNGGITYRYYTGKPLWQFGWGLSYSTFDVKWYNNTNPFPPTVSTEDLHNVFLKKANVANPASFEVQVTNKGPMTSDYVVLGILTNNGDPNEPLQKLFDFQRVNVQVGASVNVTLTLSPEAVARVNKLGQERLVPGTYEVMIGDHLNWLRGNIELVGEEKMLFDMVETKRLYKEANKRELN
jgi:hypothetical protein